MIQCLERLIEIVKTWPEARQEDAVAVLEAMAENDGGVYKLTDEERRKIAASREQARRGEFVSDAEVAAVLCKDGLCRTHNTTVKFFLDR